MARAVFTVWRCHIIAHQISSGALADCAPCEVIASEGSLWRDVISQKLSSGRHVSHWYEMASSQNVEEGESLISTIEASNGTVGLPVLQVINFACLAPELVTVTLEVLEVLNPRQLGVRTVL